MKKVLAVTVALSLFTTLFATGAQDDSASMSDAVKMSAPGELPIVEDPVTLTVFIPSIGFIEDLRTNAYSMWLEEQTGVKIEWIESSKVDAINKLSVMLNTGNYPDVIMGTGGAGLSTQDIFRYGQQGVFLPLNDMIDQYGFYIDDLFETEPSFKDVITSPDGNIYALPAVFTDDYHMTMRQKFWINTQWLKNLGLDMPTTTEEFYKVMKAFKTQDANGNGDPDDEIPMTGSKRHYEKTVLYLMNAFIPAGGQDDSGDSGLSGYEFFINDKLTFTANKNEFRDGLRYVKMLYSEGLLDVAALTQDKSQIKPLVDGAVTRIGGSASHHPANFSTLNDTPGSNFLQYEALPPLKGPKGEANTPWFIDAVIKPGEYIITDNCKTPEVAFRWADHFYRLESMMHDKGVEGTHWENVDPSKGLIGLNGKPAKYNYLEPLSVEDNAQINTGPGWTRDLKNEFARNEGFSYEEFLYNATTLYEPYKVRRYPYATVSFPEEVQIEFTDLRRTIHTYVSESTNRFIIGDLDIEKDWDNYVKQLDQIGLSRFMEILESGL